MPIDPTKAGPVYPPESDNHPEPVTTRCRELNVQSLVTPEQRVNAAAAQIEDARLCLLTAAKIIDGEVPRDIHRDVLMLMDGCRDAQARLGEFKEAGE